LKSALNNLIYFIQFFRIVNTLFDLFMDLSGFFKKRRLNFEKNQAVFQKKRLSQLLTNVRILLENAILPHPNPLPKGALPGRFAKGTPFPLRGKGWG
jgi:hypothetical protein